MPLLGSRGAASSRGFGSLANLGYFLRNSLRFRRSASAYLNRTPSTSGNRQKFTLSVWVKGYFGNSTLYALFGAGNGNSSGNQNAAFYTYEGNIGFGAGVFGVSTDATFTTTAVFRDPSAWYHIVLAIDTTQATNTNRMILYVNGVQQTFSSAQYPSQGYSFPYNATLPQKIGDSGGGGETFDGYMAEFNYVDGQQLTPSSFGKTDAVTNQWIPKKYSGAYGTNGFYLPFTNTSSTSTLVADSSGNGNNWTPNNISLTAGATYDSMTDVPTLTNATTANYATLNPLDIGSNAPTITNGSLSATTTTTGGGLVRATMAVSSGKWYWETTLNSQATYIQIGISSIVYNASAYTYLESIPGALYFISGFKGTGPTGTNTSYGSSVTNGDVVSVALDMDAGTLEFYKNGVSMGTAFTSISGTYVPTFGDSTNTIATSFDVNFGQRPFAYTLPSGYKALNTYNLS